MVVVVDGDEVSELQMTSHRSCLAGDTFHSAAITEEHICVVVDQLEAGLVEDCRSMRLADSETDGIGETLTERAGSDFDTGGVMGFGVTGADTVNLLCCVSYCRLTKRVIRWVHVHGSASGRRLRPYIRKGGSEHTAACIRDRCCGLRVSAYVPRFGNSSSRVR